MDTGSLIPKNNGMTSFVPPCFSWELYSSDGQRLVETASEIDLSRLSIADDQKRRIEEQLYEGKLVVKGHTELTDPIPPSGKKGCRLVVDDVLGPVFGPN